MTENRRLNIVVLGEMGVGKSSLLLRFAKNTYNQNHPYTVAVDVLQSKISINDRDVDLILWDTAGQEKFRSIVHLYFKKADGVLLVYDVTRLPTFTELPRWLAELRAANEEAPVLIVGNKIDRADILEKVSVERVKEFADRHRLDFMEASAKSGENVEQIFQRLTLKMLRAILTSQSDSRISLSDAQKNKRCC